MEIWKQPKEWTYIWCSRCKVQLKKLWGWFCLLSWHFPTVIPPSSSWLLKKKTTLFFILYMDNLAGLNVFSSKPSHWCLFGMAAYHVWEKIGASKQDNGVSVLWTDERLDFTVGNMSLKMSTVLSPELRLKSMCLNLRHMLYRHTYIIFFLCFSSTMLLHMYAHDNSINL